MQQSTKSKKKVCYKVNVKNPFSRKTLIPSQSYLGMGPKHFFYKICFILQIIGKYFLKEKVKQSFGREEFVLSQSEQKQSDNNDVTAKNIVITTS